MLARADIGGYTGLYGFHKYWGKKPSDVFSYLIEVLSTPGDLVLDPFVGSGVLAVEAKKAGRRFLGVDINPVAVHISKLLVAPPRSSALRQAVRQIRSDLAAQINGTYSLDHESGTATHYLWFGNTIKAVWTKGPTRGRIELEPTLHDRETATAFAEYKARRIRPIKLFDNSRINARCSLTIADLLTGRAQHNIDKIQDWIDRSPDDCRDALRACLTSAAGQMSKMVFAITGRGKTKGAPSSKVEVGSWVIGYWRPELHFEVNVWNCFERRTSKLVKAIEEQEFTERNPILYDGGSQVGVAAIRLGDARAALRDLEAGAVDLIITDPPHGDRIPYLELSELWNAILGEKARFEKEIVVSNAKTRNKDVNAYQADLKDIFGECGRVIKPGGQVVVLFNSRDAASWVPVQQGLTECRYGELNFEGAFESHYSAGSVVQDNREGGLQHDYGLVFSKPGGNRRRQDQRREALSNLPGWTEEWPF